MNKEQNHSTDLEKLATEPDSLIDYSNIPKLDNDFWNNAVVKTSENKQRITARFDADAVRWFKAQGRGYQSKMNAWLRSYYESQQ